jgi:hypothetical protein
MRLGRTRERTFSEPSRQLATDRHVIARPPQIDQIGRWRDDPMNAQREIDHVGGWRAGVWKRNAEVVGRCVGLRVIGQSRKPHLIGDQVGRCQRGLLRGIQASRGSPLVVFRYRLGRLGARANCRPVDGGWRPASGPYVARGRLCTRPKRAAAAAARRPRL